MKQNQSYSELKITLADIVWVVLGGILLGLSFPPVGWYLFAWVSFIPLFRVCIRFSTRETFILAWIFHVSFVAVAFHWPVLHLRLDTALISLVAMVALTMLLSVPFAVAAAVMRRGPTNKGKIAGMILAGFLVFILDLILQVGPVPMPWLSLGNTQAMSGLVERLAPYIGSIGIGLLVLSVNMIAAIGLEIIDIRLRARVALAITLPVLIMLVVLLPSGQHEVRGHSVKLGILQPGIAAQDWAQIQNLSRVDTLLELSNFALKDANMRPEFIIWPETALPYSGNPEIDENIRLRLSAWAVRNHVGILSGAIT